MRLPLNPDRGSVPGRRPEAELTRYVRNGRSSYDGPMLNREIQRAPEAALILTTFSRERVLGAPLGFA